MVKRKGHRNNDLAALDALIEEIIVDPYTDGPPVPSR